jgi:hypothetical protein
MKWIKKEELFNNIQKRWERSENDMKNRKVSVSWQNYTVELSTKEQVVISHLRTGYIRATHRHIIEKTDIPNCPFCDVRLTTDHILWQCSETHECGIQNTPAKKEGREGIKKLVKYVRKIGVFHEIYPHTAQLIQLAKLINIDSFLSYTYSEISHAPTRMPHFFIA